MTDGYKSRDWGLGLHRRWTRIPELEKVLANEKGQARRPEAADPAGHRRPRARPNSTASSIRRSITPRPCSIRMRPTWSRIARAINMAGAARRPRKRWKTPCANSRGPHCAGVTLLPSGAAAVSTALLSVLSAGDHILITDSVYRPTRNFCRLDPQALWRRDQLLRSADRLRHRRSLQTEHQARCSSRRRDRRASRCRTFRRSPPSRTTRARWC